MLGQAHIRSAWALMAELSGQGKVEDPTCFWHRRQWLLNVLHTIDGHGTLMCE